MNPPGIPHLVLESPGLLTAPDVAFTIPELFQRAAVRHPKKTAVIGQTWQPSYEELNAEACRAAHLLCRGGMLPGSRVAILMQHDSPLLAAVLGVLKAGGVVVVLNPADPPGRLEQFLADAGADMLLADPGFAVIAREALSLPIQILTWAPGQSELCTDDPDVSVAPDSLAFLLYTSGSTGAPKGVMQSHQSLVHNAYRFTSGLALRESDRISLFSLLGSGQGVAVTWSALLNGATLCPFPVAEKGVTGLAAWLERHGVSVFISTSSVFRHFMHSLAEGLVLPGVRLVRVGAEHAAREDFESFVKHFPRECQFAHSLSSTEAGGLTRIFLSEDTLPVEGHLPVGFQLPGVELLLHDESGREVARGQTGELVVRSRYLALGYWRNDALTAERFMDDSTDPGVRLYRTGDLACWSAEGGLLLVGRNDLQIKIRGHRIEPSEVERALRSNPDVLDAAVCAVTDGSREEKLAAFVISRTGGALRSPDLREGLKAHLPAHLVPSFFYFPPSLPLTPHGKLDRGRLMLQREAPQASAGSSPETGTEEVLARIWAGAFKRQMVSCEDDFFELGGDSLTGAVILAKIHDAVGVGLALGAFSDHPTVRRMGQEVDRRLAGTIGSELEPVLLPTLERPAELPLSFAQERLWHFCQSPDISAKYVQTRGERILGPLDVSILQRSIEEVVRRHEVLRTTFAWGTQGPVQVVHAPGAVELPVVHLDASYGVEESAMERLAQEARTPLDLETGPVLRFCLLRLRDQEHWLVRTGHHIISDDWSWDIFYREVLHVYGCIRQGVPPPWLEELTLQYADYAIWQRQRLQSGSPAAREQIEWWKHYLQGRPEALVLPFTRGTPDPSAMPEDGVIWWGIPEPTSARLGQLARKEGVTYYALRLAAFAAVVSLESGQDDFAFGAYVTNRWRVELQRLFGYFANLVTLRFRVEPAAPFRKWLKQVSETLLAVQTRSEIPYESLCEQLRGESVVLPEIRVIFAAAAPLEYHGGVGLEFSTIERVRTSMPWGFSFAVNDECEASAYKTAFDARIYDPDGVHTLIARFQRFLDETSRQPELPLESLYLLAVEGEAQAKFTAIGA